LRGLCQRPGKENELMFREQSRIFRDLTAAVDIVGLELIWLLAYYLRFYRGPIPLRYPDIVPLGDYLWIFIFFPFIWIFAGRESGLYRTSMLRTRETIRILRSLLVAMLLIITISFLLKKFEYSRLVFVYFSFLALIFLLSRRLLGNRFLKLWSRSKFAKKGLLIDCGSQLGSRLAQKILSNPGLGINLRGWIPGPDNAEPVEYLGIPRLGAYQELNQIIKDQSIQVVLICLPVSSGGELGNIFASLGKTLVDIVLVPDFNQFVVLDQKAETIDEFSFFNLQSTRLTGWNAVGKRVFDFVVSLMLLLFLSPFFLFVSVVIKLTSKGPVFFAQRRLGCNGKEFEILKFRTMIENAEALTGPLMTAKNDPRVTGIGKVLRRTSLDELPNLINVLKGEMSLVGPRPEREYFFAKIEESVPLFNFRLKFKPGMTGWAQVNGFRQNSSFERRFEYDLYYMRNWSFAFDFKILVMTLWKGFYGRQAY